MKRQEYNRLILKILMTINENMPDLRFGQLLFSAGVIINSNKEPVPLTSIDYISYSEESKDTLARMQNE